MRTYPERNRIQNVVSESWQAHTQAVLVAVSLLDVGETLVHMLRDRLAMGTVMRWSVGGRCGDQ